MKCKLQIEFELFFNESFTLFFFVLEFLDEFVTV